MFNKDLPEDIIIDIFSCLPAKSIGRCRCVSKQWRDLLSQPDFINTHLYLSQDRGHRGIIFEPFGSAHVYSVSLSNAHHVLDEITVSASTLHFADISNYWRLVSSFCDGLVLVADREDNLFVVNPTTREIRKVPAWRSGVEFSYGENVKYGFGYDSIRDDYKVVVHVSQYTDYYDPEENSDSEPDEPDEHESILYVYSLRNGTWKTTSNCPHFEVDLEGRDDAEEGVFLNGHIYWLDVRKYYKAAIMDFDLEKEVFRRLPHYSSYRSISGEGHQLAVICERLWIIDVENNHWLMEECGDEDSCTWTEVPDDDPDFQECRIKPLCLSGQDEMVLSISGLLAICSVKEETLKKIVVHGIEGRYRAEATHTYTETLVSPNNIMATGRGSKFL